MTVQVGTLRQALQIKAAELSKQAGADIHSRLLYAVAKVQTTSGPMPYAYRPLSGHCLRSPGGITASRVVEVSTREACAWNDVRQQSMSGRLVS